ncbi:MAG: serine hydrolase, partial [Acidobacteriota bacterium]|nr:serine hydrolase [Acidobacteriota bacterium]
MKVWSTVVFLAPAAAAFAQSFSASPSLDAAIEQAIQTHRIPGAVLLVGHQGVIIHRKAYGNRALVPALERMTIDTIFDCASLTKVIATTSGMMKLFEQGKVRIADKVTDYLPEFQGGKSDITIANLMTHYSGLRPDLDLEPPWSGYETGIQMALRDPPAGPPGVRFVYSDINFILLGEIVRRLSGESEPDFLRQVLFEPLAMHDTMFNPPASLRPRIAPTEELKTGEVLRGVVHDPTSRNMGGVAGHAGLFSTADDLSRFCQTMLDKGEHDGLRLFSPLTIDKFTSPNSPPGQRAVRGLGWDIDSPFSGERGELFPIGSYGHTGFTGTSLWMDPASDTFVILLTNSVHPHLRPSITSLRGRVATIVAAAVGTEAHITLAIPPARTGLDVLVEQRFRPLAGKRIGLITNHTGVDREGKRNIDRMIAAGMK